MLAKSSVSGLQISVGQLICLIFVISAFCFLRKRALICQVCSNWVRMKGFMLTFFQMPPDPSPFLLSFLADLPFNCVTVSVHVFLNFYEW